MISLVHRTVFVHIPKCAGQSVEAAFCADLGLKWQKHRYLLGCFERPKGWSDALPERIAHLTAHEYTERNFLPKSMFRSFYTFAIIRDPVERAISMWRFLPYAESFERFVGDELPRRLDAGHFFYRPQAAYLTHPESGDVLVDHVIPFSTLSRHWPEVMRRAGISAPLEHRNAAPATRSLPDVTAAERDALQQLYSEDYDAFAAF